MATGHGTVLLATDAPRPTEKQLKQTLKNTKYGHPGSVARHILSTIDTFPDLKPTVKEFTFANGKRADLMQLSGTVPVTIVDNQYNIPVRLWLPRAYPKEKPFLYINPTADMAIASVGYIDRNGKVNVTYLSEWKEGRSDLTTLIQVARFKFSQQCPVYTVRKTPIVPKSGLTYSQNKEEAQASTSCGHEMELDKMKLEVDKYKVEVNMLKTSLQTANQELSLEKDQVRELKKKWETQQRGSFTSGVIDAMQQEMQQQIVNEREMKLKYKQRLDTMVTEITQVREEIGILRVDKEDYQQRLRTTTTELQHTKKKMLELRNELSIIQGRFEAAETNLAKEQAESESLKKTLEELKQSFDQNEPRSDGNQVRESVTKAEKDTNIEVKELREKLKEAEEKLVLATSKAAEIEKEKDELLTSFLAQVSQASLMEQQLFEEKQQLQLQLDGTFQQLQDSLAGQQVSSEYESASDGQLEANEEKNIEELLQDDQQCDLMIQTSDNNSFQTSVEANRDNIDEQEVQEVVLEKVQEGGSIQQVRTKEEEKLQEQIPELTERPKEKEVVLPSLEAHHQVINERDNLKEKLDEALIRVKTHEESEERMREKFQTLQSKLKSACEDADKLRMNLEKELERSKLKSELEAELMEKTCVVSQLTAEKVSLQFKVKGLQQQFQKSQENTGKLIRQFEADISDKSLTVVQLTVEKDELLRNFHELQKQIHEVHEPQINDKDIVCYEEVKLTQNMLGTGAWGYVVKGTFRGKVVAVKCIHNDILSRFSKTHLQREISIMAELRHPNLVLFIAAVLDAPTGPMIITELLSYTLRRAYQDKIITTTLAKISIMLEVALALNYLHLHHKPIIHRDISSTNVLLEELANKQWRAKLSDFGSANLVRLATTPGEGALVYSAPEMRTEAHKPQAASADVYSYGVLLCEVITASFPDHSSLARMLDTAKTESKSVSEIIELCLSENPSNRPTIGVVIVQLDELINMAITNN